MKDQFSQPQASLTEFERALLDAARQDRIPSELELHMAKALPDAASGLAAHSGKLAELGGTAGTKAWLWGTLFALVCAGGYAALRPAAGARSPQPSSALAVDAAAHDARLPMSAGDSTAVDRAASTDATPQALSARPTALAADSPVASHAAVSQALSAGSTALAVNSPTAAHATVSQALSTGTTTLVVNSPTAAHATVSQALSTGTTALAVNSPTAAHATVSTARVGGVHATGGDLASLHEELALLERARHALQTGAQHEAQLLLKQHSQRFEHAALEPEAEALRIDLLVQRGEPAQAKRAAQRFLRRYSDHPLAVRVARVAAGL